MFYDDDKNEDFWNRITFEYNAGGPDGISKHHSVTLNDKESYVDIMQEFVYFLNAIGYTYVGGLAAFDQDGDDLASTDI